MPEGSIVSRRRAAALIAGTLVASAGTGASAAGAGADAQPNIWIGRHAESEMLASLASVRHARGLPARAAAFDRFKVALEAYDRIEIPPIYKERVARGNSSTLYRQRDPSGLLSAVIVRELDAWPGSDPGWLGRFSDLEAAVKLRVGSG